VVGVIAGGIGWPTPAPIRRRTSDCEIRELPDGTFLVGCGSFTVRVPEGALAAIFGGAA
jgi:hypothetical protein